MTEFTAEFIDEQRKIIRNGTMTVLQMKGNNEIDLHINMMYRRAKQEHCEKYYPEALDHIEHLQAKTKRLKHYLEEAAHAAACGKNPADYLAREVPTELRDEIERLQARVQELEIQLKSKDIIINNQQGRLNYYATKDLFGGKR